MGVETNELNLNQYLGKGRTITALVEKFYAVVTDGDPAIENSPKNYHTYHRSREAAMIGTVGICTDGSDGEVVECFAISLSDVSYVRVEESILLQTEVEEEAQKRVARAKVARRLKPAQRLAVDLAEEWPSVTS